MTHLVDALVMNLSLPSFRQPAWIVAFCVVHEMQ
eukprot:CAMPEP_0119555246 /NCGR_PEP_ID=MMETSP1352-20130426/7529_1 /TAXON_ID=265584 /ORGANISM="Stauroneis constricta, Strain CCMP1120" /LENGTH=33 /DNA_ID= /DNA_START= /DNA_END= /DNA_ORIENTATION=